MKKILAFAAALALLASAACAETYSFVETGTLDADGNVVEAADLTDPLYIDFDNETKAVAYGTDDDYDEGTYEVTEETDAAVTVEAAFTDGESAAFTYDKGQNWFTVTDEDDGADGTSDEETDDESKT